MNNVSNTEQVQPIKAELLQGTSGTLNGMTVVKLENSNSRPIQVSVYASNLFGTFTQQTKLDVPARSNFTSFGFTAPEEAKPITITIAQSPVAEGSRPLILTVNRAAQTTTATTIQTAAPSSPTQREFNVTLQAVPFSQNADISNEATSKALLETLKDALINPPATQHRVLPTPRLAIPTPRTPNSSRPLKRTFEVMEGNPDEPTEDFGIEKAPRIRTQRTETDAKRQQTEDAAAAQAVGNASREMHLCLKLFNLNTRTDILWGQPIPVGDEIGVMIKNPNKSRIKTLCRVSDADGRPINLVSGREIAFVEPDQSIQLCSFKATDQNRTIMLSYLANEIPIRRGPAVYFIRLFAPVSTNVQGTATQSSTSRNPETKGPSTQNPGAKKR